MVTCRGLSNQNRGYLGISAEVTRRLLCFLFGGGFKKTMGALTIGIECRAPFWGLQGNLCILCFEIPQKVFSGGLGYCQTTWVSIRVSCNKGSHNEGLGVGGLS